MRSQVHVWTHPHVSSDHIPWWLDTCGHIPFTVWTQMHPAPHMKDHLLSWRPVTCFSFTMNQTYFMLLCVHMLICLWPPPQYQHWPLQNNWYFLCRITAQPTVEQGSEIWSQMITGDTFRMHLNVRCEHTYLALTTCDQIPQDGCQYQVWTGSEIRWPESRTL